MGSGEERKYDLESPYEKNSQDGWFYSLFGKDFR